MSQTEEKREGFYLSEDGEWIPDGWVEFTLVDLVVLQRGFDLPAKNRVVGGFPLITASGQDGTHNEGKVKAPGVVTGRSGTIGQVFLINNDFWPLNTTLWVKDFKGNDVIFCYYFLKRFPFSRFNSGSGVPTLNRNHIHPHSIAKPPLPEQKAIASVLGSLDDKIELLREQNETLEALAQTLFRRWFIDFNFPDENGNPYKDSGGTMIPSELGEIPEGWEVVELQNIATLINGRAYKNSEFLMEGTPIIRIQNLSGKGKTVYSDLDLPTNKYVSRGDLIFAWSATFGPYIWQGEKSIYHYHIWKIDVNDAVKPYLYWALKYVTDSVKNQSTGSIFSHVTKGLMEKQEFIFSTKVVEMFSRTCSVIHEKIESNNQQIQTLTNLRDTLLPKLMKGEIRIKKEEF